MWTPLFVMPNLRIRDAIETPEVAIVPSNEERVVAYGKRYPEFIKFVRKFTDAFGVKCEPGIVLMKRDIPAPFRTVEAISSFRDLLALSVIPIQRARSMTRDRAFYIQYSDFFDFYPWRFNENNGHITCNTPSILALHIVKDFKGQSSPELSPLELKSQDVDQPLLDALLAQWRIRYKTRQPKWEQIALFRSLNMAVAAAKIPGGAILTQFDIGRNIGLWVSAFEILTHPGEGKVGLMDVYAKIGELRWKHKKLKSRRYKAHLSKPRRNLMSWLYGEIYKARNAFLHGNPVDQKRLTVKRSKRNLYLYPAPLYRMMLAHFLKLPRPTADVSREFSREQYDLYANQNDMEEALSTVLISEAAFRKDKEAQLARVRMRSRAATPQRNT